MMEPVPVVLILLVQTVPDVSRDEPVKPAMIVFPAGMVSSVLNVPEDMMHPVIIWVFAVREFWEMVVVIASSALKVMLVSYVQPDIGANPVRSVREVEVHLVTTMVPAMMVRVVREGVLVMKAIPGMLAKTETCPLFL